MVLKSLTVLTLYCLRSLLAKNSNSKKILFVLLQENKLFYLFVFCQFARMLFIISCGSKVVKCKFKVVKLAKK